MVIESELKFNPFKSILEYTPYFLTFPTLEVNCYMYCGSNDPSHRSPVYLFYAYTYKPYMVERTVRMYVTYDDNESYIAKKIMFYDFLVFVVVHF